jgi:hypothetical protein
MRQHYIIIAFETNFNFEIFEMNFSVPARAGDIVAQQARLEADL